MSVLPETASLDHPSDPPVLCAGVRFDGSSCDAPATIRYAVGCVHEHIREIAVCEDSARIIEHSRGYCRSCFNGPDPHECRLLGRRLS